MKIGFAITSSYCTIEKIMNNVLELVELGYDVVPIASPGVINCDTRFGKGKDFKEVLERITGNSVVSSIIDAERFGPSEKLDLLVRNLQNNSDKKLHIQTYARALHLINNDSKSPNIISII